MPVTVSAVPCKSPVLGHCNIYVEESIILYDFSRTSREETSALDLRSGMIKWERCTAMSCTGFERTIDAVRSYLIVILHLLVSMWASSTAGGGVMGRVAEVIMRMLTSTCACVYSRLSSEHDFVFHIAERTTTQNLIMRRNETYFMCSKIS